MVILRVAEDVEKSQVFYEKFGYMHQDVVLNEKNAILFADGRMNYLLKKGKPTKTKFTYFTDDLPSLLQYLQQNQISFKKLGLDKDEELNRIELEDPNQFQIEINSQSEFDLIPVDPRGDSKVKLGNFGEFAIPTVNFEKTKQFWQLFGFEALVEMTDPYPWGIFTDGLIVLGIHEAADFSIPTMTYFKLNMLETIKELQSSGIGVKAGKNIEIEKGNGIVIAPDGQQFFFFEGDVK